MLCIFKIIESTDLIAKLPLVIITKGINFTQKE